MLWLAGWKRWQGIRSGLKYSCKGECVLCVLCTSSRMWEPRGHSQPGWDPIHHQHLTDPHQGDLSQSLLTVTREMHRGNRGRSFDIQVLSKAGVWKSNCSRFSSSKQKYQLRFADFRGIFGKKKKEENFLFYKHTKSCFNSLCIFNISFYNLQDKTESLEVVPFPL